MRPAAATLPLVLRGLRRSCRHCGAATTDLLGDSSVGFSCCDRALEDQIRYRSEELERLRADAKREQDRVTELDAEAQTAAGYKVDEARARADRARAAFAARLRDHYEPIADDLKADIARAQALLDRRSA
jgi:hypothetical protein